MYGIAGSESNVFFLVLGDLERFYEFS